MIGQHTFGDRDSKKTSLGRLGCPKQNWIVCQNDSDIIPYTKLLLYQWPFGSPKFFWIATISCQGTRHVPIAAPFRRNWWPHWNLRTLIVSFMKICNNMGVYDDIPGFGDFWDKSKSIQVPEISKDVVKLMWRNKQTSWPCVSYIYYCQTQFCANIHNHIKNSCQIS